MQAPLSNGDPDRVPEWSNGYFHVDAEGFIRVCPERDPKRGARLADILDATRDQGLSDPLVLRFPQILSDRQSEIFRAFSEAIEEHQYPNRYQGVFPVKVNHDRVVVETLMRSGYADRFGIEVGSKAELCLALTLSMHPEAYLICNGFKDGDYLELAIHAARHGRRVMVIAENPREIDDIINVAREVGPGVEIGFRTRLHSAGVGRWQESSGQKGKFGLSTIELLESLDRLEAAGLSDAFQCLHFHIGSQVSDILNLKEAIKEATRLYCALKAKAPSLSVLDLGGGLGIDYDGSRSATDWSVNYTLGEYARDAIWIVQDICRRSSTEPPLILTESGRALCAYHAVAVVSSLRVVGAHESRDYGKYATSSHQVKELKATLEEINDSNYREAFHDATILHNDLLFGFKLGYVGVEDRAVGECLYRDICRRAKELRQPKHRGSRDMIQLDRVLAPKYVCNFSIFMSLPDSWAVQQLFPVVPLERLNDTRRAPATIGDITCDSDGKLEHFIGNGGEGGQPFIMLHDEDEGTPYSIGVFLVGAYQDVLGDFHNLFGTPSEAVVQINGRDDFSIIDQEEGSSVERSLDYFGFSPVDMVRSFDRLIDRAQSREAVQDFKGTFLRVLHGGTYLDR